MSRADDVVQRSAVVIVPLSTPEEIGGTWALTSYYEEDEYGEIVDHWGMNPNGVLAFSRDGRFAFQIADDLGLRLCIAYAGHYEIADGRLRLHPDAWATPGTDESERVAKVSMRDSSLEVMTAGRPSLTGSYYSHTFWKHTSADVDTRATRCAR